MGQYQIVIHQATLADVERMHSLINAYASKGLMLAKSRNALYQNVRDFFVADAVYDRRRERVFAGCGALHVLWADLGEIRSLAVEERFRGNGVGRHIVRALLEDATRLQLPRIFALTYQQTFFERLGFVEVDKDALPRKVWGECLDCPKFPNCDEIAMLLNSPFERER